MKYKVGDKVRVRKRLIPKTKYGGVYFAINMREYEGEEAIVKEVGAIAYHLDIDGGMYWWTDEMFEGLVEEELTAEEAIRILGGMCRDFSCCECPIYELIEDEGSCDNFRAEKPDKVIEVLKQQKKNHEKKEVEITQKIYCLVVDEERKVVHEEEIGNSDSCMDVLKNYCENHDGKFFSIMEFRYEVKQ